MVMLSKSKPVEKGFFWGKSFGAFWAVEKANSKCPKLQKSTALFCTQLSSKS
jgi:hypothetical protein